MGMNLDTNNHIETLSLNKSWVWGFRGFSKKIASSKYLFWAKYLDFVSSPLLLKNCYSCRNFHDACFETSRNSII